MSSENDRRRSTPLMRTLAVPALALGLAVGGFGVASAVTGSGSGAPPSATSSATPTQVAAGTSAPAAVDPQHPWGGRRPDETALTGDTATRVRQAALAKTGGGTVERGETDADGHAGPRGAHRR